MDCGNGLSPVGTKPLPKLMIPCLWGNIYKLNFNEYVKVKKKEFVFESVGIWCCSLFQLSLWGPVSCYLEECSLIVNCIYRNKVQWNLNKKTIIFIEQNAFENVCQMSVIILFRSEFALSQYPRFNTIMSHESDNISKSLVTRQFVQQLVNIMPKLLITNPLWWGSTGHRWIPLTKGQ